MLQWVTFGFLIFQSVVAIIFVIDRWVHRLDEEKQDLSNQIAGRPSLASRLNAVEEGLRERTRNLENVISEKFVVAEKERGRLEVLLDERWTEGIRQLEISRSRLHEIENWRQKFGAQTEIHIQQNEKDHDRYTRQFDALWRREGQRAEKAGNE